jgi:hypothetical protein
MRNARKRRLKRRTHVVKVKRPWATIKNKKGQLPHKSLIPADKERCQANPNVLGWSPMSFGPRPTPQRCTKKPVAIIVENVAGAGDKIGSMSLCESCLKLFQQLLPEKDVTIIEKGN